MPHAVRRVRVALALLLVALAPLLGTLGARPARAQSLGTYSAAPIRGRVVDAESKQPLPGVHVVAQWILQTGLLHSVTVNRFHILETITDATGDYAFPSWGPKPRPLIGTLDNAADPELTFFKPGYRMLNRSNSVDPHDNPVRTSRWNGRTIELQPFRGTLVDWVDVLQLVQLSLAWGHSLDHPTRQINDHWKHFPVIVLTVLDQREQLPPNLQHRVRDLGPWDVSEAEVRRAAEQKGSLR